MKGLLLKDCYVIFKQARILLIMTLFLALMPTGAMFSYALCYAAILPISALGYDERAKWDQMAAAMPYTKKQLVTGKYFIGYGAVLAVTLLICVSRSIYAAVNHRGTETAEIQSLVIFTACIALCMMAVCLPIMFKIGVEKGRMIYIFLIVGLTIFCSTSTELLMNGNAILTQMSMGKITMILVAVTIILNLISVKISEKFYFYGRK